MKQIKTLEELGKKRKSIVGHIVLHAFIGAVLCYFAISFSYDMIAREGLFEYVEEVGLYTLFVWLILAGFYKSSLCIFRDDERELRQIYKDIIFVPFFKKLN